MGGGNPSLKGFMEKLEEYLKDLEGQRETALVQVYKIEGAIQTIRYLIAEKQKEEAGEVQTAD